MLNIVSHRPILQFVFFILLLVLTSCVSTQKIITTPNLVAENTLFSKSQKLGKQPYYPIFGTAPQLKTPIDLFKLTEIQELEFLTYLNEQLKEGVAEHEIVAQYLSRFIVDFNYHSGTMTAQQALNNKEGNCLSLAILTTALAKLANVQVKYQLMEMRPVFLRKGNTIFTAQHVRSILYDPSYVKEKGSILFMKPLIAIDYFPTMGSKLKRMVSDDEFYSMYYRNKAAEEIAKHNYTSAYWLTNKSFEYSFDDSHGINMLALIYDKSGFSADAEKIYQFGIANSDEKLELLSNYKNYLISQTRIEEAKLLKHQINEIDQPNPFEWLKIADREYANGNLDEALKYYDKTVDLAPYLDQGYSGRAKVEFLRGNNYRAKIAFEKAIELSISKQTSALYQAKVTALEEYQTH